MFINSYISRSTSFVIAFLMKENIWSLNEAFKFVYKQRSIVYPNRGFQKQLKKYEIELGLITKEEFENEVYTGKMFFIDDI